MESAPETRDRGGFKAEYLLRGLPGHPIHPPLTDVTIGGYMIATLFAVLSVIGVADENTAVAWWLTLLVAQISAAVTALTGFVDWLQLTRGTPLWRTATIHMVLNIFAAASFGLALILGHGGYADREIEALPLLLTLTGFGLVTLGGWVGGTIVYVHGMRVLGLEREPTERAVAPAPMPEKEAAEED